MFDKQPAIGTGQTGALRAGFVDEGPGTRPMAQTDDAWQRLEFAIENNLRIAHELEARLSGVMRPAQQSADSCEKEQARHESPLAAAIRTIAAKVDANSAVLQAILGRLDI